MDPPRITCPHCWQSIEIESPEPLAPTVEFTTDCEVCCRPIRITATWQDSDLAPDIQAYPESD